MPAHALTASTRGPFLCRPLAMKGFTVVSAALPSGASFYTSPECAISSNAASLQSHPGPRTNRTSSMTTGTPPISCRSQAGSVVSPCAALCAPASARIHADVTTTLAPCSAPAQSWQRRAPVAPGLPYATVSRLCPRPSHTPPQPAQAYTSTPAHPLEQPARAAATQQLDDAEHWGPVPPPPPQSHSR